MRLSFTVRESVQEKDAGKATAFNSFNRLGSYISRKASASVPSCGLAGGRQWPQRQRRLGFRRILIDGTHNCQSL